MFYLGRVLFVVLLFSKYNYIALLPKRVGNGGSFSEYQNEKSSNNNHKNKKPQITITEIIIKSAKSQVHFSFL